MKIQTQTGTGDIVYVVPDQAYAVDARTDTGDETITVSRSDASPRLLQAHTQTGDVVMSAGLPVS